MTVKEMAPTVEEAIKRGRRRVSGKKPSGVDSKEMRQAKVAKWLGLKTPVARIAEILGIHRNTVTRDIAEIRRGSRQKAIDIESFEEIGKALQQLEEIQAGAMSDYLLAKRGSAERNGLLRTAKDAINDRIALLQESGLVPKVVDQLHLTGAIEINKAPLDVLQRRFQEIVKRIQDSDKILGHPEDAQSLDVRDAEVLEIEEDTSEEAEPAEAEAPEESEPEPEPEDPETTG